MKHFETLVLAVYITCNELLSCEVTHEDFLLIQKTRICLLSMATMAKLSFGPTLALHHSQKDPWKHHKTPPGLSINDMLNKQCTAFMSSHSRESFTLPEKTSLSSSWKKMAILVLHLGPTLAQWHGQKKIKNRL